MEEFGIFTDEGCIEDGFVSREAAEARAVGYRASGDAVSVHPICHDHPEQIAGQCEECDAEDDALGCSQYLPPHVGDIHCGRCGHRAHEHRNVHTNRREG